MMRMLIVAMAGLLLMGAEGGAPIASPDPLPEASPVDNSTPVTEQLTLPSAAGVTLFLDDYNPDDPPDSMPLPKPTEGR